MAKKTENAVRIIGALAQLPDAAWEAVRRIVIRAMMLVVALITWTCFEQRTDAVQQGPSTDPQSRCQLADRPCVLPLETDAAPSRRPLSR